MEPQAEQANRSINIVGNEFMVDGKQLRIISGSLHYFRLPAAYWRDRLRKLKAAGLNSVATYEFLLSQFYHYPLSLFPTHYLKIHCTSSNQFIF